MAGTENLGASFTIDISSLKAGLQQANRLIKESNSEFKAAAAGMGDWSKSQEGVEAKIKNLTSVIELQEKKVQAQTDAYEQLIADGLDPTSSRAVQLRTEINNEKAALEASKKELDRQKTALSDMATETTETVTASQKLRDEISKQESELSALSDEYSNVVLEQGKDSQAAKDLKQQIESLSGELKDNNKKLEESQVELKDTGDAADNTGDGFTVAKGAVAGFISNGLSALVGACSNAISSIAGLAEETREFRQDMSTLETAFSEANFSAETATDTWKSLYGVFGEDDKAVEAANNIARMAKDQQDLNDWVNITTGVWGTYQDALPVEAMAESAGETAKVGGRILCRLKIAA